MSLSSSLPSAFLPVDSVLDELLTALNSCDPLHSAVAQTRVLLQAPPGAGKTTRVPLALIQCNPKGSVLMLEPRRLAARAAARRMAAMLGEAVGRTVGYRVRLESRVSAETRITVVTEGVLTRLLRDNPDLPGVRWLLFDEFHERHLQGDLGLALALDCQEGLRDADNPLHILVMSATLDAEPLRELLAPCSIVGCLGRQWPVETRYLPPDTRVKAEVHAAGVIRRVLHEETGSVLVFLPGAAEINRVRTVLGDALPGVQIHALFGDLLPDAQDAAIAPAPPGIRKVVLATAIAESSLTIEGVRVVVDAGQARAARFDPGSGMSRLVTERVSQSSADQRRGRAGRLEPGLCLRLWPEEERLRPTARPEILDADLADLRLELALWGIEHFSGLRWLDAPPSDAWAQATDLLVQLDALAVQSGGKVLCTAHGRALAGLPVHPRVAHMLVCARERGFGGHACILAALLEERDPLGRGADSVDVRLRLHWLRSRPQHRLRELAKRLSGCLPQNQIESGTMQGQRADDTDEAAGLLLALAYPDRVAQARSGAETGLYRLSGGRGARLFTDDPLCRCEFLAVGELDGGGQNARIFQAAPLTLDEVRELFAGQIQTRQLVDWDSREEAVLAREQTCYGALVLRDVPLREPAPERTAAALVKGFRELGLQALPWTPELLQWRARVLFLRARGVGCGEHRAGCGAGKVFPDLRDGALMDLLEDWLIPAAVGVTRRAHFRTIDLKAALLALFDPVTLHEALRTLDTLAPESLRVPTGSHIRLRYPESLLTAEPVPSQPEAPVLAVKLQELFGLARTPEVAGVPVLVHLLSPAGRPLQVTADLAGFWASSYAAVRADMRGRYPRHPWPENPLEATPTRRTNPRK